MVVRGGIFVSVLRTEAVAFLREAGCVFGDIDKVPVVALVAVSLHVVSPIGNGSKAVIAEQQLQVLLCGRCQVSGGNVSHDGVALGAPGRKMGGNEGEESQHRCEFFHESYCLNKSAAAEAAAQVDS